DLAGGAPAKLELDEPIESIAPSPDGRWVVLAGSQHLLVLDRANAGKPDSIFDGTVLDVAWQIDSKAFVAMTDEDLLGCLVDPSLHLIYRYTAGSHYKAAIVNSQVYVTGPTGVISAQRENPVQRVAGNDFTLGLALARDDALVAGRPTGITVMTNEGDRTIPSPVRLSRIAATPNGNFVVAAAENRVLVWDLDKLLPHTIGEGAIVAAGFVTGDQIVVANVDAPAQWIDLSTNKTVEIGELSGIAQLAPAPDGHRAAVIDAYHHGRIVAPIGDPIDLGDGIEAVAFLNDRELVVAHADGRITLGSQTLVTHDKPVALAVTAETIAVAFDDGTLWREDLASHTIGQAKLERAPLRNALAIVGTGVVYGTGNELRMWTAEAKQVPLGKLGRTITNLAAIPEGRVIAIANDGAAMIVSVAHPAESQAIAMAITSPSFTSDGSLVGSLTPNGAVEIVDPITLERWTLSQPRDPDQVTSLRPHRSYVASVRISPDGQRVLAQTTGKALVWTLALPKSPEATVTWIDALTNAMPPRGPAGPLEWK
ncbi:MAG TPA: hypothetical protein VGC41_02700, partial [Kofleriaceae bacterium]